MSNPRHEALRAIALAQHKLNNVNFKEVHVKDLFGENVFNEATQRERLPKGVFKALQRTIKTGATLDARLIGTQKSTGAPTPSP